MTLPDFLIVGAAKCGTTSLYKYLSQHEEVFLNKNKEPKYFVSKILDLPFGGLGDQVTEELMTKSFPDYVKLFEPKKDYQITGEASVDYLYYADQIVDEIKDKLGDVKIIIMLRHPTERAFSAYKHLVRDVRETKSFEEGLELEEKRKKNNFEFIWYYRDAGLYHKSVKKYVDNFTNVKIINFNEFVNNTDKILCEVFNFLNVNSNCKIVSDVAHNKTGVPKSKFLQKTLVGSPNQLLRKTGRAIFPESQRKKIRKFLEAKNLNENLLYLNQDTKEMLDDFYEEDLKLLKRDFNIDFEK